MKEAAAGGQSPHFKEEETMATTGWPGATAALAGAPEADGLWRQGPVRLGYIDYLNCLPVYLGIEQGVINLPVCVKKGPPAVCNRMFLEGALDVTPISSIEFARNAGQCVVLPDLSISADGKVASIHVFTRKPLSEVKRVALTTSSATSVVLTKIILAERYGLQPTYLPMAPHLPSMLAEADAALLIGDDSMLALQAVENGAYPGVQVLDLGIEWKELTGLPMVYALWVVRAEYAGRSPEGVRWVARLLQQSQAYSWAHPEQMVDEAARRRALPRPVLEEYFTLIRHSFGPEYRAGLRTYLEYAKKHGELDAVPELRVWGE